MSMRDRVLFVAGVVLCVASVGCVPTAQSGLTYCQAYTPITYSGDDTAETIDMITRANAIWIGECEEEQND